MIYINDLLATIQERAREQMLTTFLKLSLPLLQDK
jgi:hypothetical protein